MTPRPAQARLCKCERPLLGDETCLRCGHPPTVTSQQSRRTKPPSHEIDWTRPRVVRAMKAFAFFRGRPPVSQDWHKRMPDDWPALETVVELFGSLDAATRAAGVARPRSSDAGRRSAG